MPDTPTRERPAATGWPRDRRGVVVPAAAGVFLAVLVVVLAVGRGAPPSGDLAGGAPGTAGDRAGEPAGKGLQRGEPAVLELDLPGTVPEGDLAACLATAPGFATGPASVEILYQAVQATPTGSSAVLLLRNQAGELWMCDLAGGDRPAVSPLPTPSAEQPVVFLGNGRAEWECSGTTLDRYTATLWLSVGAQVASVRQRYVVDDVPGTWFGTDAVGGYAHLQTWLDGPLPAAAEVTTEHQVLDAAGEPVDQDALPASADLAGCSAGEVQLG